MTRHVITLAAGLALCPLLPAQDAKPPHQHEEAQKPGDKKPEEKKPEEKKPEKKGEDKKPEMGRAEGSVTIGCQKVEYKVTATELPILKDGKPAAQVFYTSYTLKSAPDAAQRPVTFCFNGGPGSSSVWVHLGAFGPRKVELPADGLTPPLPPGRLVENPNSLLDVTDLVFIDPVNTGYSRAEDPQKVGEFLGVREDVAAVGEFIRLWLTREKRWRSPKFIAGESYGGIRGAGLAEYLASHDRIYLNGLVIVSGLLDYDVLTPGPLNDLPYQVLLPALTSVAHYHHKLPPDLQADRAKAIAEARAFAYGDYAHALLLDNALPKAEHEAVVKKLARLTGLEPKLIEEQRLRIDGGFFREMLLRDQHLVLGGYDARVTAKDGTETEQRPEMEPFMNVVGGVAAVAINSYLREELHYEKDLPYEVLKGQPGWNHGRGNSYTSMNSALATAIKSNPHLHVLALVGMSDLVTPADNMIHSLRHMPLPESLRGNVSVAEYEAGHMMYTNEPDQKKMHADISAFMKACLK